jgi:hypothetical protein
MDIIWANAIRQSTVSIKNGQITTSAYLGSQIAYKHCDIGYSPSDNILIIHPNDTAGMFTAVRATRGRSINICCQTAFKLFKLFENTLTKHRYYAEMQNDGDIFIFLNKEIGEHDEQII